VRRLLNDVRYNTSTALTIARLRALMRPLTLPPGLEPTRLFSRNIDVSAWPLVASRSVLTVA
jgi:hypothetical protein